MWAVALIKHCAIIIAVVGALSLPQRAMAQSCSVTPASGSFGTIDVLAGSSVDSTSSFSVTCSGTADSQVRLCIELGRGASAPGPMGQRALTFGADYIAFEFYSDASRTQLWGSWGSVVTAYGSGGITYDLGLGPTGSANPTFNVYARVLANQQTTKPSTYSWNGATPALRYGYDTGTPCPTGSATTYSSGTTWTATVAANCNVSATNMNFGSVGLLSSGVNSTSIVTVRCTNTSPFNVGLSQGSGTGATVAARIMESGANTVIYSLYSNSGRTTVWGDTIGTDTVSQTGTGNDQPLTVYGRVPAQSTPAAGTYNDTIVITVTY